MERSAPTATPTPGSRAAAGADAGAAGPCPPKGSPAVEAFAVGGLVACALAVRAIRWEQTFLMFNDGPTFLWISREMAEARWREALAHNYHPLYSFTTLVAHFAIPSWEDAAASVSIVAGGAAVLLLFLFLRSAFGRREAWLGALLLAVQPRVVELSANVQSDGLYLALFLASALALWSALRSTSIALAGWAGALTGLAYLTRPEGLVVAVVAAAAALLAIARGRFGGPGRAAGWLAAFGAALALFVLPYATVRRVETGTWQLSGKKPVTGMIGIDDLNAAGEETAHAPARRAESEPRTTPALVGSSVPASDAAAATAAGTGKTTALANAALATARIAEAASSGVRPWFLAVLLVGVFSRRGRPGPAAEFVWLFVVVDFLLGFAQYRSAGYLDMRHVLPPLVLGFGYFAPGIDALAAGVVAAGRRVGTWRVETPPRWLTALLVAATVAGGLGQALRPEKKQARAARAIADWLGENAKEVGAVAAPKTRLAYYANRPAVSLYGLPPRGAAAWLGSQRVRYVIVDDDDLENFPSLREAPLSLIHCIDIGGRWAAVYRFGDDAAPDPGSPSTGSPDAACADAARGSLEIPREPVEAAEAR